MHTLDSFFKFLSFFLRKLFQKQTFAFEIVYDSCNYLGSLQPLFQLKEVHLWGVLNKEAKIQPICILQSLERGFWYYKSIFDTRCQMLDNVVENEVIPQLKLLKTSLRRCLIIYIVIPYVCSLRVYLINQRFLLYLLTGYEPNLQGIS